MEEGIKLNTSNPENTKEGETEVDVTDLVSPHKTGKIPGRFTSWNLVPSFRTRTWMTIAIIAGIVLLVVAVLGSLLHMPKAVPITHISYPVTLSVVDGICYTYSTNGVVTALRVSDGLLLWRHAAGRAGEESITVVDGIIYLAPVLPYDSKATTVTVDALRASDGSRLWSHTLPKDLATSLEFTAANGVVYVMSEANTIDALRASDGSLLWHYTSGMPFVSLPSVANGVVYAGTQDGHLYALRASDGFVLWKYTSLVSPAPLPSVVANGMVYLNLQDGSMNVLRADNGVLLWRYRPSSPAMDLFPLPVVSDGVVYVLTQDGHLYALRTSDGFTVWRVVLHTTNLLPPMTVTGQVIYVEASDGSIDALRTSNGSVIWSHQGGEGGPASITIAQGVVYLAFSFHTSGLNSIGSITALRASDGFVLWHYTPHVTATQLSPSVAQNLVLIALQDGNIDALRASSGTLQWHHVVETDGP